MPLQYSLPRRRAVVKSGIQRAERRIWPRHRKFVRSFGCCVPGCEDGPIEFAHVRSAANAGIGLKPADWNAVSLCTSHHAESHRIGVISFEKKYNIDLPALAAKFVILSPDASMRDAINAERRSKD